MQEPGRADLNPDNDFEVGPPTVIPDCRERLETAGVRFDERPLPLKEKRGNTPTCGSEQAVAYLGGPGNVRYRPTPLLSCGMALALAEFEVLLQEHAERALGQRVTRIEQLGTYSCRKMARYPDWVSEHSYANAIDISALWLESGRRISVLRHFGALDQTDVSREADFLRDFSRSLYSSNVFSVVLTPYFDRLHKDHFHLDLARYRMDGTGQ